MLSLLRLSFLPKSADLALLGLRLWLGLTMLLNHGLAKLTAFDTMAAKFPALFGLSSRLNLGLAVFAEVVCSALIILGIFTRFAALSLAITMGVAFFIVHKASLAMGPGSGELAFVYLGGYVALLLAGGGRYGIDKS